MVTIKGQKIADYSEYINLDKRTDRREKMEEQFLQHEINGVQRFSAVSSYSSGPLNCKKSHFEIYKKFLETDYETLLVLEDDCLFLPSLTKNAEEVLNDIYSVDWDIFWLGCRNRIWPMFYKNKTYKTLSVSHTQSYLIKRNFCKHLLETYPMEEYLTTAIDELLCLSIYGKDVVYDPHKYNFYQLSNPLESLPLHFTSLCYESALTTQYQSYSDLWDNNVNYSEYLIQSFPNYNKS